MRQLIRRLIGAMGLLCLAALALTPLAGATGERATGTLVSGSGAPVGTVQLEQGSSGVTLTVLVQHDDLVKPGDHGIHLHTVGRCDGADFASAGGHFNPTGKQHGAHNPAGAHAGDLANLTIGAATQTAQGYRYVALITGVTLSPGPASLFDADGTALVIHANPDDELTDPAGNSGTRIACAVLTQTAPGLPSTGAGGAAPVALRWQALALLGLLTLAATATWTHAARRRRA